MSSLPEEIPQPPKIALDPSENKVAFEKYLRKLEKFMKKHSSKNSQNRHFHNQEVQMNELIKALKKDIILINSSERPKYYKKFFPHLWEETVYSFGDTLPSSGNFRLGDGGVAEVGVIIVSSFEEEFSLKCCPLCYEINLKSTQDFESHMKISHGPFRFSANDPRLEPQRRLNRPKYSIRDLNHSSLNTSNLSDEITNFVLDSRQPCDFIPFCKQIVGFLTEKFKEQLTDFKLFLYGSSMNGFGTITSDIDMCILLDLKENAFPGMAIEEFMSIREQFRNNPQQFDRICEEIIFKKICDMLEELGADNIVAKMDTRVKIVSFKAKTEPPMEVDISINNRLGIQNSNLLFAYSKIDPRVNVLGIAVKKWAKNRDIANPRYNTLSPYAYVIMVIYFLQNTDIPILPVLQSNLRERIIDGVNCWFDSNFESYQDEAKKNNMDVGRLFIEFFKFYAMLDFEKIFIDISKNRYRKVPKSVNNKKYIFIRDPFEAERNLGDVCNVYKATDIKNEIGRSYQLLSNGYPLTAVCEKIN